MYNIEMENRIDLSEIKEGENIRAHHFASAVSARLWCGQLFWAKPSVAACGVVQNPISWSSLFENKSNKLK